MNTLKNLLSLNDDERLLAEVRTYQEKLISNAEEPIWERKWLTIEEAAAYSGIGRTKLRELSNQAGCPFAIWMACEYYRLGIKPVVRMAHEAGAIYKIGKKVLIRRSIFEAYMREQRKI